VIKRIFAPSNFKDAYCAVDYIKKDGASSSCSFEAGERGMIRLTVSRKIGISSIEALFFDEYVSNCIKAIKGCFSGIENGNEIYVFNLGELTDKMALMFFTFKFYALGKEFYINRSSKLYVSDSFNSSDMLQITVSDFAFEKPKAALGGIIYHIFVDRFNRGGNVKTKGGAVLVPGEWEQIPEYPDYPGAPLKNNTFYGGTLYGIIDKLDYIKSLGANIIYLSPIFSSVSNHKYDTADYMQVDEMFGGDEALSELIFECDKRDIKIILDGVFNHTGDDSIYFNKYSTYGTGGAYNSKNSLYYSWYDFKDHPDKYVCWWDIPILPRINPDVPECGEFIAGEGGVIEKYRNMGIYGLRLDVADELSDNFLSKIKDRLSKSGENLLYGEVWEDASSKVAYGVRKHYYLGSELDGVMNYPIRVGIIDYIVNKSTDKLNYALRTVMENAPKRIRDVQMNLIGSHDTFRALTALSGKQADGRSNKELCFSRLNEEEYALARQRLMSAYTVLATIPGIPSIFYGDEAGLEGYSDPFCRMPYPWGKEDSVLLEHYKLIGKIRRKNKVYEDGEFNLIYLSSDLLIFERYNKKEVLYTLYNNAEKDLKIKFSAKITNLFTGKSSLYVNILKSESVIIKSMHHLEMEIVSED